MPKRKRLLISLLAVVGVVLLSCAGLTVYVFLDRGPQGAADYPAFRAANAKYVPFMPPALTAQMTGVRFITHGFDPMGFMAPDGYVELRFILPPAQAAALEATSATTAATLATKPGEETIESLASMIDALETADDENRSTKLPPGFHSYILFRPGANAGGVSINAASGEVVYWRFDF